MNTVGLRTAFNRLRFMDKRDQLVSLGRNHSSAAMKQGHFGNCLAAAKNSSVAYSVISRYSSIGRRTKVTHADVGEFCSISRNCTVIAVSHSMQWRTSSAFHYIPGLAGCVDEHTRTHERVRIDNDVSIGAQGAIVFGIQVDDGAVNGAGAIVNRNVEAYELVVGNLAKHLEWKFKQNIRNERLTFRWWDWEDRKICKNTRVFQTQLTQEEMEYLRSA